MIPPSWRFYSPEGALTPGGPHTWDVIDWDLRRWFQVTGPAEALPDDEDGVEAVARHVDKLGPDIHCLKISADGDLIGVSTDDPTWEVRYPEYPGPLADCEVAYRPELTEIDRLQVCTDLVEYNARHAGEKKEVVVFKYTIYQQRVEYIWRELHTLKALQGHESFVAFHRVVLDDVSKRILGFTSQYIAGGTLENYRDRPFYFNWLKQLTDAIGELNLGFGIMHQDVAPRNILFEPSSNSLKVFDFDRSCLIGDEQPGRNDVDGVIFTLYETLTKDGHFRRVPFHQQQVGNVEEMEDWPLVVPLEGKGVFGRVGGRPENHTSYQTSLGGKAPGFFPDLSETHSVHHGGGRRTVEVLTPSTS
ncbi:hypothetical protein LOZ52_006566 [Ophidiomyces ophidiicola]|nr:hypothetical protein LOZ49_006120 [Ophidiomyces ophidiicola]KAI2145926.1 hypothetical protein LOZ29_000354 [Ophidiomyces ophidiicola]KAI2146771.1 hypothetical protein LOZ28_000691 [Ophidiomyces ophidiicola]KAI2225433.1 hypothetical protein LOZ15_000459 [Ophidiomyces ophidiicola]KAI2353012.1 hypothetical protein LOY92_002243 [Ophidiomyces ophidiicola]